MKFHMLMLMNEWMMLVLMKCKCQMQCLTLGCYNMDNYRVTSWRGFGILSPLNRTPPFGFILWLHE